MRDIEFLLYLASGQLVTSADITACLRDHMVADDSADWYKAVRAVADCSGPILEVLAKHLPGFDLLKRHRLCRTRRLP